jgi:hypothetical protein
MSGTFCWFPVRLRLLWEASSGTIWSQSDHIVCLDQSAKWNLGVCPFHSEYPKS